MHSPLSTGLRQLAAGVHSTADYEVVSVRSLMNRSDCCSQAWLHAAQFPNCQPSAQPRGTSSPAAEVSLWAGEFPHCDSQLATWSAIRFFCSSHPYQLTFRSPICHSVDRAPPESWPEYLHSDVLFVTLLVSGLTPYAYISAFLPRSHHLSLRSWSCDLGRLSQLWVPIRAPSPRGG